MPSESLELNTKLLHHLVPFHLVWKKDGTVAWLSPGLRKYWGIADDVEADPALVRLHRPFDAQLELRWFEELTTMVLYVGYGSDSGRQLRSELLSMGDEGWLLVGVPPVSRVRDLDALGMRLSDLPMHMGTGDLLIANEAAHVSRDNSERVTAQLLRRKAELKQSLHEKEILLKEIHHRVKNNLQIISSLLMMQSRTIEDPVQQQAFSESVQRVRSIAMIHELLYGMDSLVTVDLGTYTQNLAAALRLTLAPLARIEVHVEPVEVRVELAMPVGLILNELMTNAFKYGVVSASPNPQLGGRTEADVVVELSRTEDELRIIVADNGPGMPDDFDLAQAQSLGLTLIHALVRQVRGKLEVSNKDGARFELTCMLPNANNDEESVVSSRKTHQETTLPPSSSFAPGDMG